MKNLTDETYLLETVIPLSQNIFVFSSEEDSDIDSGSKGKMQLGIIKFKINTN